jgi:hypothetical protein
MFIRVLKVRSRYKAMLEKLIFLYLYIYKIMTRELWDEKLPWNDSIPTWLEVQVAVRLSLFLSEAGWLEFWSKKKKTCVQGSSSVLTWNFCDYEVH